MPYFKYKGIDPGGKPVSGTEFGPEQRVVSERLASLGISILDLREVRKPFFEIDFAKYFSSVSTRELKYFYVNLSTLIGAGCSLRASIGALAEQAENAYFARTLTKINSDIGAGLSFSGSLALHPRVFSQLFIHLVKAGEEGGMLEEILVRNAAYEENQEKIRGKVRGALVLPAIMVLVSIGVVIGLLTYVFPKFMELFAGKESMLPGPTKFVMAVSDFLRNDALWLIGFIFFAIVLLKLLVNTRLGFRFFSILQLRVPLFGELFRKVYVSRFSRTLAALTKGGVPTLRALKITVDIIPNVIIKEVVGEILINVEKGGNFTEPMRKNSFLFPSMVTLMMHVGETTGNVDHMLNKVADYYDADVEEVITAIIATIEPIMTVIMGGVVLVIALSMFLPLFDIGKILK